MNRKIVLLLSLIGLLSVSVFVYADALKVVSAFASFPKVIEPIITHTAIQTVSLVDRILSAKISVNFGSFKDKNVTAKIKYYVDGKVEELKYEPDKKGTDISNDEDFFITLPKFLETNSNINYQIEINFSNNDGEIVKTVAFPSTTTYQYVTMVSSASADISASAGGTVEFGSGNQQYPNTKLEIRPDALSKNAKIIIKQLPIDEPSNVESTSSTQKEQMLALYQFYSIPENVELMTTIKATFYYGATIQDQKFCLKYKENDAANWVKIPILNVDLQKKIIISNISSFGYYGVFKLTDFSDNDYRPKKRVVVKGRDVFKFNNLKDGDSIKIFTTSGKKIRDISSGDAEGFKWDGKKNDGSWAKSGIYVYQIKVNGKTISGTIAFVK